MQSKKRFLPAPEVVESGVSVSKRVSFCTISCGRWGFGAKKSVFLHQKLLPGRVWCAGRAFPAPEVVGKRIPYSNSVVRKRYMVGNMNAALARKNIRASAIGMPLDLRNRDACG